MTRHELKVGDRVRLVGKDWGDARGRIVTVDEIRGGGALPLPWSTDPAVLSLTRRGGVEYEGFEIEVVERKPLRFTTERTTYDGYRTLVGVNRDSGGVSLGLSREGDFTGIHASLTSAEARRIGWDLIERADEIDAAKQ